jgi:N-methylhydantoinase B/oxoprolinase/acetone carboxylase alpha subunit
VSELPLAEGDLLCILSPGGGGFGDPRERLRDAVREDLANGMISRESANKVYHCSLLDDE